MNLAASASFYHFNFRLTVYCRLPTAFLQLLLNQKLGQFGDDLPGDLADDLVGHQLDDAAGDGVDGLRRELVCARQLFEADSRLAHGVARGRRLLRPGQVALDAAV